MGAIIGGRFFDNFRRDVAGRGQRLNGCGFQTHRGNKAVAMTGNSFDESWVVGTVVERGTEFFQNGIQASVEIDKSTFRPKSMTEFLAGNDLAGALQQQDDKDAKWLVLDLDSHTTSAQRVAGNVRLE